MKLTAHGSINEFLNIVTSWYPQLMFLLILSRFSSKNVQSKSLLISFQEWRVSKSIKQLNTLKNEKVVCLEIVPFES